MSEVAGLILAIFGGGGVVAAAFITGVFGKKKGDAEARVSDTSRHLLEVKYQAEQLTVERMEVARLRTENDVLRRERDKDRKDFHEQMDKMQKQIEELKETIFKMNTEILMLKSNQK